MRINHNIAALTPTVSGNQQFRNFKVVGETVIGLRINRAGDDAAGLAISERCGGRSVA